LPSFSSVQKRLAPGNVREPQNAVERAVILSQRDLLRFELAESKAIDTHFGLERDNFMVSKFTPTDEAFEHRAPYW
jgi:DNA-binding NtrC family response regulator